MSVICVCTNLQAGSSKAQLIRNISGEQNAAEKKIIQMWMQGERGKEFEIVLADYVSREVRYRAMSGEADNGTLLSAVSFDQKDKVINPMELGRLLVLEYFKRKGVNLKNKRFVKGTYTIGIRADLEQAMRNSSNAS
jgi:hypothetical protein